MTTLSIRHVAEHCLGATGDLSVNNDLYGYVYRETDGSMFGTLEGPARPLRRSLRRHLETASGRAVDLVMILVGHESDFSGAVSRDDVTKVQYGIQVARDLFAQVDLGIRKIVWGSISLFDAGELVNINGNAEARRLARKWSGPPGGIDVFLVQTIAGAAGLSPAHPPGPCNKDQVFQMTGSLVQLSSDHQWFGMSLAHEIGHYLGLEHTTTPTNLMCGDLDGDGIGDAVYESTGITADQAATMRSQDLMKPDC